MAIHKLEAIPGKFKGKKKAILTEADLPPLFLPGNVNAGNGGLRCLRCGIQVKGNPILMFRDWRIHEFHDFGGIPGCDEGAPSPYPDGPYEVGPECAGAWRKRAKFKLNRLAAQEKR